MTWIQQNQTSQWGNMPILQWDFIQTINQHKGFVDKIPSGKVKSFFSTMN